VRRIFVLLVFATLLSAAAGPRVFYSREMSGGFPEYVQIVVDRDGSTVYRESVDDPDDEPLEFRLHPAEVDQIFSLAKKLDYFEKPLESNLKVANMGRKTFRWEDGGEVHEQKFNFSKDMNARLLADWFARITAAERNFINLERTVQFDKLGVNKVLLQLQVSIERKRLVAGDQFLPLLDRIAANESFLNMARSRAANLAEYIRSRGGKGK